jgi:isopenicillin-N N-acyltransferase like protein
VCSSDLLYAEDNDEPGIKAGVNEKGLCVISASASSIPKKQRDNQPGKHGLISILLSKYATVDDVIKDKDNLFPNARTLFYMISDKNNIVIVEVGLKGKYTIKQQSDGKILHTNHFLDKEMSEFNFKPGISSTTRLDRITKLMNDLAPPYNVSQFVTISRDQNDGPDNSLWRVSPKESTLASWILANPKEGAPTLRLVIANPGKKEELHEFTLDEKFWKETK